MGFIRVIHQQHYDPDKGNFKSLAFKPSSDGSGISVIDEECISQGGIGACEHIDRFYENLAGEPPVFWNIPANKLPQNHGFIQSTSTSGDVCHHNLIGVSEREARLLLKQAKLNDFRICTQDGSHRPLTVSDTMGWNQS